MVNIAMTETLLCALVMILVGVDLSACPPVFDYPHIGNIIKTYLGDDVTDNQFLGSHAPSIR